MGVDGGGGGRRMLGSKKKKEEKKKLRGHKPGSPLDKKEFKRNVFTKWLSISEKQVKDRWSDKRERGDVMVVAKQIITGMKQRNKRRGKGKGKKNGTQDEEEEVECVRTCPIPDMDLDNEWLDQKKGKISDEELKSAHEILEATHALQKSRVHTDLAQDTDLDFCFNVADFFEIDSDVDANVTTD